MMEKRGVCSGEGEEPQAGVITKASTDDAIKAAQGCQPKCYGNTACGTDPLSKMSDAVKDQSSKK